MRQERMYQELKRDYYLLQAVFGGVNAADKCDEWRDGIAVISENRIGYEHTLARKNLQIWGVKI